MSIVNDVRLKGNLVADPVASMLTTANGEQVKKVTFRLAVNNGKRSNGQERPATFVDVEAFRGRAEVIEQYLHKGDEVWIQGELKTDSWVKDGVNRSRLLVDMQNFEFGRKKAPANAGQTPAAPAAVPNSVDDLYDLDTSAYEDAFPSI